jgi:hypothetical protein
MFNSELDVVQQLAIERSVAGVGIALNGANHLLAGPYLPWQAKTVGAFFVEHRFISCPGAG